MQADHFGIAMEIASIIRSSTHDKEDVEKILRIMRQILRIADRSSEQPHH